MGFSSPPHIVLSYPIPALHDFILPHPRPVPSHMTEETFLPHPCPLGLGETPPHPVKLYLLLIFPTTSTNFLMKPISLIEIYLKLQLNLSHQTKSIFRKISIIYLSV